MNFMQLHDVALYMYTDLIVATLYFIKYFTWKAEILVFFTLYFTISSFIQYTNISTIDESDYRRGKLHSNT